MITRTKSLIILANCAMAVAVRDTFRHGNREFLCNVNPHSALSVTSEHSEYLTSAFSFLDILEILSDIGVALHCSCQ
jgi:hypothetical protein